MEATVSCYWYKKIWIQNTKDSEIKDYTLSLGIISKYFTIYIMKKNKIKRKCEIFSVDFNPTDTNDNLNKF